MASFIASVDAPHDMALVNLSRCRGRNRLSLSRVDHPTPDRCGLPERRPACFWLGVLLWHRMARVAKPLWYRGDTVHPVTMTLCLTKEDDAILASVQALTGRLRSLAIWPLSRGEIARVHEDFFTGRCAASVPTSACVARYSQNCPASLVPSRPPGIATEEVPDVPVRSTGVLRPDAAINQAVGCGRAFRVTAC